MDEDDVHTVHTETEGNISEAPRFRVSALQFFVTYPQCDIPPDEIIEFFKKKRPYSHICVAQETHEDGNFHLHVYVKWQKKYDCSSAKAFDYKGFHPNIQGVRSPEKVFNYVRKSGNYIQDFSFDFLDDKNFIKRKNDFDSFTDYVRNQELKEFNGPLILNGIEYAIKGLKDRHLCIVADANWGKTEWIENTFEGYQIYKPNGGRYPMDHYNSEKVLIFDDHIPKLELLLSCSNVYKTKTPVGDTRYTVKFWPMKQERLMILLLNEIPTYAEYPAFMARFKIIDLRTIKTTGQYEY